MATVHRELNEIDVRDCELESGTTDGHDNDDYGKHAPKSRWGSGVPGRFYRFRNSGNVAVSAGVVAGIATYAWGILPAWAGFLAGTLATVVVLAVIQARNDARRSAQRTISAR
jgi:hypothetical protein